MQDDATQLVASEPAAIEKSESMEVDGAICSKSTEKPDEEAAAETVKPVENGDAIESESATAVTAEEPVIESTPIAPIVTEEAIESIEAELTSSTDAKNAEEAVVVVPEPTTVVAEKAVSAEEETIVVPEIVADSATTAVVAALEKPVETVDELVQPAITSDADVVLDALSTKVEEKLSEKGRKYSHLLIKHCALLFICSNSQTPNQQ